MKKLIGLVGLALLGGCATVEMSAPKSLNGVAFAGASTPADRQIVIRNEGAYLFWVLPLVTGDIRWDAKRNDIVGGTAWFADYSGINTCYETLQRIAAREQCDLTDVIFTETSRSSANVTGYVGLAGFLYGVNSVAVSAVLRPQAKGANE